MRIAYIVTAFPVISETFILNQITGLIDRGHEVDIYTFALKELETPHSQIKQYHLLDRTLNLSNRTLNVWGRTIKAANLIVQQVVRSLPATCSTLSRIRRARIIGCKFPLLALLEIGLAQDPNHRYDIIHCQYGTLGRRFLALKKAGLLSGKFITAFRGHDITQHAKSGPGLYDELFKNGDLFLPVSHSLEQRLVERGCDPAKIRVLHSGIDCSQFCFRPRTAKNNEAINILTIGRFVEMKGILYGVESIAGLIQAGKKVHYDIIGDGPMRNEISEKIKQLGIESHVTLHGWKDQESVTNYLDQAHILLAPSVTARNGEAEGIPNVVKEAMATGLPVISTVHSGIPELVENGVSGFLVPERDVQAMTDRLAYLIDHPEEWESMGRAGRKKIEDDFDNEKINDYLVELYQQIH
jgi:colanic acid/amylovoran biosynthesis glycosyltransferase